MTRRADNWVVFAGGGTSGHLLPGLAVAQALVSRGRPQSSIHFLGSRRGIEAHAVPDAGFDLTQLAGRGLPRRLSWSMVRVLAEAGGATIAAIRLFLRLRPAVVVSLGGYASVPGTLAALVCRVPVVVMEQNAVPGRANRLAGRVARACAVSFAGADLPRATLTGNPVRSEILAVDRSPEGRAAARRAAGIADDRRVVVVVGGSLGSRRINDAVAGAVRQWADRGDLALHHIVGSRDWDPAMDSAEGSQALAYTPVAYEDHMDVLLGAADLVVGRAGAGTVAELAVVGAPSILVPLPGAPGDHQTANARVLERAGAAVIVPDDEFDAERLVIEVDGLLGDPARLLKMSLAARACARPYAAEAVATLVERWAKRP